jgi:predicted RNA-binding protein YlxR (DUF448 family)
MCIACRSRHPQHTLIRLKQEGNDVIAYNGYGRSFYLCDICTKNEKRVKGLVKRFKLDEERFVKLLMESVQQADSCDTSHSNEGVNQ